MTIKEIKKQMLEWKDFYGGDIMNTDDIEKAKTKKELAEVIERHRGFLEMMANDADGHLDNFKKRLGLNNL